MGRIAALVPQLAVKDLPLGRTHDDDDDEGIIVSVSDYPEVMGSILGYRPALEMFLAV